MVTNMRELMELLMDQQDRNVLIGLMVSWQIFSSLCYSKVSILQMDIHATLTRKPKSHARILIYQTWPITADHNNYNCS